MRKIWGLIIMISLVASFAAADQGVLQGERCESCISFKQAMQNDLPELFSDEEAGFAGAGDNLSVWLATSEALKNIPSDDITLNNLNTNIINSVISSTTIIPPPPPPPNEPGVPLGGKKNIEQPPQED